MVLNISPDQSHVFYPLDGSKQKLVTRKWELKSIVFAQVVLIS